MRGLLPLAVSSQPFERTFAGFDDVAGANQETASMSIRYCLAAVVVAAGLSCCSAFAQTASPPVPRPAPSAATTAQSKPSAAEQVETWTSAQWEAAKKEWTKDKTKWADCRKQSSKQTSVQS